MVIILLYGVLMRDRYKEEVEKERKYAERERAEKRPLLIKHAEQSIISALSSVGFLVSYISDSPFKILAESSSYSFVADIKLRRLTRPIPIAIMRVDSYSSCNMTSSINDRLLILKGRGKNDDYPDRRSHGYPDCYVSILDIPNMCYTVGPYYVIEHYHTTPLSALRKIIEKSYEWL